MRLLPLMLALFFLLMGAMLAKCAHAEDWSCQQDKQLHLGAGASVGTVMLGVGAVSELPAVNRFLIGLAVVTGVAVGKETMDIFGTGFSPADAIYTVAGGASVLLLNFTF